MGERYQLRLPGVRRPTATDRLLPRLSVPELRAGYRRAQEFGPRNRDKTWVVAQSRGSRGEFRRSERSVRAPSICPEYHTLKSPRSECVRQVQTTLPDNRSGNSRTEACHRVTSPHASGAVLLLLPGSTKKPCSIRLERDAFPSSASQSNGDDTSHSMSDLHYTRRNLSADKAQEHRTSQTTRLNDRRGVLD